MTRALRLTALLFALTASSCAAAGNSVVALFESPRHVENKLINPVRPDARLAVTWVGHATTLIQIDDRFILTDPVFTSTVGLLSKRLVEPGLTIESLPTIDAVLISHMHFDHLSQSSIEQLAPKLRTITVPEGGLVYTPDVDVSATALAPFSAWEKDGLRVTAVPVKHSGARYGADGSWRNAGFSGYVVEYHGLTVYYGGDTAYCKSCFSNTATRFPHIDLAVLPIGPIAPRGFMESMHEDPPEAFKAFHDLGARFLFPIHFDTFINSSDEPGDDARSFLAARSELGLTEDTAPILPIGGQRVFLAK